MKKLAQLFVLALTVITLSACGKMGELENVKVEQAAATQAQVTTTQAFTPELDILPHNSK